MLMMPMGVLTFWITGLLSFGLLGGGIYLGWAWYEGIVVGVGYLVSSIAMTAVSFLGWLLMPLLLGRKGDPDPPDSKRDGRVHQIERPDGTLLHVEEYGPAGAPAIVLTHGWGLDSTVWCYLKRGLTDRYRVIVWDLPGLGLSASPRTSDWSLEKMASDLQAVVDYAGEGPVLLMGHSIGGMITLTFCKLFPDYLGRRIDGIILENTTYTNPVLTCRWNGFTRAIQKPILEPLCVLQILLGPVVWLMTWLSYLNGSVHLMLHLSQFGLEETSRRLDFAARYSLRASPTVLARGMLAMMRYDASTVLDQIPVPVFVVTGDRDHLTLAEAGAHISRTVPLGEQQEMRHSGHLTLMEKGEDLQALVAEFALKCLSTTRPSAGRSLESRSEVQSTRVQSVSAEI